MNDSTRDRLDDRLLEDLGRLARDKQARGKAEEPGFEPMTEERRRALVDRLMPTEWVATPAAQPAANDRGWLRQASAYLATAAAAAAAAAVVVVSMGHGNGPSVSPSSETSPPSVPEPAVAPPFRSWRIDGGGPPPAHQGPDEGASLICPARPLRLTLAVEPDHAIDPSQPLQLVLQVTPSEGPSHRLVFDLDRDDRFAWTPDGRALTYAGPLEDLAPLRPGSWVLQPSVGAPGSCSATDRRDCTALPARTLEVGGQDRCDGAE